MAPFCSVNLPSISDTGDGSDRIVVAYDQFLTTTERDSIRNFVKEREHRFLPATTVRKDRPRTLDVAYRRASVLSNVETEDVGKFFVARVGEAIPTVLTTLGLPVFKPERISVQITSTGDGGFYKRHTDNSAQDEGRRLLSYVYFCNPYPSSFVGGILRIYATRSHAELQTQDAPCHLISPEQNRIVFFRSDYIHEICPVTWSTGGVSNSRLTINGWIYTE